MVPLSLYGTFRKWERICKNTCYKLFGIFSFALILSSRFNLPVFFSDYSVKLLLLKSLCLIETKKLLVTIVVSKLQRLILRVKRRVVLLVHCFVPKVPVSPQNPKMISITILLRSTAPKNLMSPSSVNIVNKSFQDFTLYVNIETVNTECRLDQEQDMCVCVDVEHIVRDDEDQRLREKLRSCKHFLVDSELERARHSVFNYAVETLNETIVNEKLDHFFNHLKYAAKVNLAFSFNLKNIEDGGFRYFYAHENDTLLDRSKLVCTRDDLAKLTDFLNKIDVLQSCSQERMSTKWRFYKLTNLTVFAALLKDVPVGCMAVVLPEPLLKNCTINCLTFEENTRQSYNDNLCLFLLLLSICREINNWKKKHPKFSIHS